MDAVTSQFGLHQLIKETMHILENSSFIVDLIFTSHPNLVMESSVHLSVYSNCHHQRIFAKFNLQIYYPPPHEREIWKKIWHYQNANTDHIRKETEQFGIFTK